MAPERHREKLGRLFIGIVGSGCARGEIVRMGLGGQDWWMPRGLEAFRMSMRCLVRTWDR